MIDRVSLPDIRRSLWSLGLDVPTKQEFLDLESQLLEAAPQSLHKYLTNPKLKKTKKRVKPLAQLIVSLKLAAYFNVKYDFEKLLEIFNPGDMRGSLEGLLLTTLPLEEIATLINHRYGQSFTKEDLVQYKLIFYDLHGVTGPDWSRHLAGCDQRSSAIKIYASQNREEHERVKYLCGMRVNLEYTDLLEKAMHDAFFQYTKVTESGMPDSTEASTWARIMAHMGDRLKKWGGGQNADAVKTAIRILVENQGTQKQPQKARVHKGDLPVIDITPGQTRQTLRALPAAPVETPEE